MTHPRSLTQPVSRLPSLAVLHDFPEENWPSMDLAGEMLLAELQNDLCDFVRAERVVPRYRRLLSGNADRFINRFIHYPRHARRIRAHHDLFHIVDHSYAHLVHQLPGERTGVYCHDLDAFRCLFEPDADPRPQWFRAMSRRILRGMQKAAIVFHTTMTVREQIMRHGLVDARRLVHAPLGAAREFVPRPASAELPRDIAAKLGGRAFVLHVGSCIPRKRIDVLVGAFARVAAEHRELMLVQVGGVWTNAQRRLIDQLHVVDRALQFRGLTRGELAELYRTAKCVLLTSDAEGFGLPVVEALACGAPVIASDIPAVREVAGDAVVFAAPGACDAFASRLSEVLRQPRHETDFALRLAQAARFSWGEHARMIWEGYESLLGAPTAQP
ncbi:MAG: glycosyltransferase family 4 protein [Tepidisphaeraceae bacterium]